MCIVVKNEESFWKIKKTRDMHDWHTEYVCLVHGHVSVEQWEGPPLSEEILSEDLDLLWSTGRAEHIEVSAMPNREW